MAGKRKHRGFGHIRKLPSGRYQASYIGPDTLRHNALTTFQSKVDAEAWLGREHALTGSGAWSSPSERAKPVPEQERPVTIGVYAGSWLTRRDLKPRTRAHYASIINRQITPTLGDVALVALTPRMVAEWHHALGTQHPTLRAHCYGLLRTICSTAVAEREIPYSPCVIRGAGVSRRKVMIKPATLAELEAIAAAMPAKYRPMVMLSSWCGLRFGEATELRRKDLDLTNGTIHVRRGVVRVNGQTIVGTPKSDAGSRDVAIPPHLLPMLRDHVATQTLRGKETLLFPAGDGVSHLARSTLFRVFQKAREAAGRPDLRWHDLRHTGAVLAAQTGATLAELMGRLGHSTPAAAMRYQHVAQDRDMRIAVALSRLAEGGAPPA